MIKAAKFYGDSLKCYQRISPWPRIIPRVINLNRWCIHKKKCDWASIPKKFGACLPWWGRKRGIPSIAMIAWAGCHDVVFWWSCPKRADIEPPFSKPPHRQPTLNRHKKMWVDTVLGQWLSNKLLKFDGRVQCVSPPKHDMGGHFGELFGDNGI